MHIIRITRIPVPYMRTNARYITAIRLNTSKLELYYNIIIVMYLYIYTHTLYSTILCEPEVEALHLRTRGNFNAHAAL
jgi:hypothetical protein